MGEKGGGPGYGKGVTGRGPEYGYFPETGVHRGERGRISWCPREFFSGDFFWILNAGTADRKNSRVFAGENFFRKIFQKEFVASHRMFRSMIARLPSQKSRRKPVSAAVALALLLAMAMAAGCTGGTRQSNSTVEAFHETGLPVTTNPPIPQNKYIFIEHWIHTNAEMISGDCCGGPIFGEPPGFRFDEKNGVLEVRDYYSDKLNESLILFYAGGGNLSGCAGMGEDTWGLPVYSLPFTPYYPADVEKNVTIESISGDGTISLSYNREKISLKSGETWSVNTTRFELSKWNSTVRSGETIQKNCTKKFVTTDSFYNAGILDKGSIGIM